MTLFWKSEAENETECIRQFPTQKLSFFLLRKKKKPRDETAFLREMIFWRKRVLKLSSKDSNSMHRHSPQNQHLANVSEGGGLENMKQVSVQCNEQVELVKCMI